MKKQILNFLKKYWLCILLSIIMSIGWHVSYYCNDLYRTGGYFDAGLCGLYSLLVVPIYSIIYGGLSYIILKKVLVPQLVLYAGNIFSFLIFVLMGNVDIKNLLEQLIVLLALAIPIIFSLFGCYVPATICAIAREIKKNAANVPKTKEQGEEN